MVVVEKTSSTNRHTATTTGVSRFALTAGSSTPESALIGTTGNATIVSQIVVPITNQP
jgi:hypothetical protein